MITGRARLAGVMGWPVGHSLSPILHGYWLAARDIDGAYVPLAVRPEYFGSALRMLPKLGFAGVNVTMEEAIEDDALKPSSQAVDQLGLSVDAFGLDLVKLVDTEAAEALHDEHFASRVFVMRYRCTDVLVAELAHDLVEAIEIGGFAPEVELFGERLREVVDDADRVRELGVLLDPRD